MDIQKKKATTRHSTENLSAFLFLTRTTGLWWRAGGCGGPFVQKPVYGGGGECVRGNNGGVDVVVFLVIVVVVKERSVS